MPSEREPEDDNDSRDADREPTEPEDTDSEESEASEPDDGRILGRAEPEPLETVDEPRNRAERRVRARQLRRGQLAAPAATASSAERTPGPARRPPPRTVTGKSSADEVPPWARQTAEWLGRNRTLLVGAAVAVLAVVGGAVYWTIRVDRINAAAAGLYASAVETANAPIRPADAPPDPVSAPPRRGPTYVDTAARSRAALDAFRRVGQQFPTTPVAGIARLGEGVTLYELGRYAEARRVLETLIGASNLARQDARAHESLGFALEALNDLPAALRRYEELARIDEGASRDLAQFHQARVLQRQSQSARAKDVLHGLIERLQRSRPGEPLSGSASGSVLEQAKALLHDIDPEDPLGRRAEVPSDPDAILRMLERQTGRRIRLPAGRGGAPPPVGGP